MTDAILTIGGNTQELQRAIREAERAVIASMSRMEKAVTSRVTNINRSLRSVGSASNDFAKSQKTAARDAELAANAINKNAESTKKAGEIYTVTAKALTALAEAYNETLDRALHASRAVINGVGSYLGAKQGADSAARANNNLSGTLVRLAATYLSLRKVAAGVRTVIDFGSQAEQQRVQFDGLFRSVAQGQIAFQWVRDFPVQAQGFQQALSTLRGFGVDNVFNTLKALNNQVLLLGDEGGKLQRVALAIGQAFAAGAFRAEELNQLIDAGVPVFQLFSKVLGVSAGEVRKLASEGKIGRDEIRLLIAEIERSSAGAAEKQLGTFGGIISQLEREFRRFVELIADSGAFEFVKEQLRLLLTEIQRLKENGELQKIAENISDAIVNLGEGIADFVKGVLRGLKTLGKSDDLKNFAGTLGGFLTAITPLAETLTNNLINLVKAYISFKAVIAAINIGVQVTAWVALVAITIKYRAILLTVITATKAYAAAALAAIGRVTGLTTVFTLLQAALVRNLKLIAAFSAGIAAFAVGFFIANARIQAQINAQRALARELEANRKLTQEFIDIRKELDKVGQKGISDQIGALFRLRNVGAITDKEALDRARKLFQETIELTQKRASLEQKVTGIESQLRQQNAEKIKQANIALVNERIKLNQQELRSTEQKLNRVLQAEKRTAQQLIALRTQLRVSEAQTEEEISDIKRQSLSDDRQQFALKQELFKVDKQISESLKLAREAESQEAQKIALNEAKRLQQRKSSLASEVDGERQRIQITRDLGETRKSIIETEIALQEQQASKQAEQREALKQSAADTKALLAELNDELRKLQTEDVTIELLADANQTYDEIANVNKQLEKLARGVVVPIRANRQGFNTGGQVPGFAHGGRVFGRGGIDNVPAWLTAGEFVITKAAVQRYGTGFFQALNAMKLPSSGLSMPSISIPKASAAPVQRFQDGGSVLPRGQVNTLVIKMDNRQAEVSGTQQSLDTLTDILALAARGAVA